MKRGAVLAAMLVGAGLVGCKEPSPTLELRHNPTGAGTKVATFGNDSISAEELSQRFAEMPPFMRARYQTAEQRKTLVEDMARFELLAQEAERRKMYTRPEIVAVVKQAMVQKLLEEELTEKPASVTDADVQAYYDAHTSDFVKPEMVRLAHVFLKAPEGTPERAKRRAEAQAVLAAVKKLAPHDGSGFGQIVREKSEEPRTKPVNGDLRYLTLEELSRQYDPRLAEAAATLQTPGDVAGLVEAKDGYHVVRLLGRQRAVNQSAKDARAQIVTQVLSERRARRFHEFLGKLAEKSKLHVDTAALDSLKLDLTAPAQPAKSPPPQVVPAPPKPASTSSAPTRPAPPAQGGG